jgi:hypothetical protein
MKKVESYRRRLSQVALYQRVALVWRTMVYYHPVELHLGPVQYVEAMT